MGKWKRCTRKTKNNGNNEQSNILLTALLTMKTVSCRWYIVVKDSKYETTLFNRDREPFTAPCFYRQRTDLFLAGPDRQNKHELLVIADKVNAIPASSLRLLVLSIGGRVCLLEELII